MDSRVSLRRALALFAVLLAAAACGEDGSSVTPAASDGDTDSDSDSDGDSDGDSDSDGDTDTDADADSDSDSDSDSDVDTDTDSDTDGDTDTDTDADTDSDTEPLCEDLDSDWWCSSLDCVDSDSAIHPGMTEDTDNGIDDDCDGLTDEDDGLLGGVTLTGTVMAPSELFPIPGALIYISSTVPPPIADEIFCYECEDMTGHPWTLSDHDGTFELSGVPDGTWYLITRKGLFQRIREIVVTEDPVQAVPVSETTLPGEATTDDMDQIPNYAVLLNYWDQQHNLLAKLGMGDLDSSGNLIFSTESFDIYNDDVYEAGYPYSSTLFASQETIDHYHMVFFPCTSSENGVSFVNSHTTMLQNYVSGGGKIYNSCCTALWIESPWPDYIDFYSSDATTSFDIGRISSTAYSTTGNVLDTDLAAWLDVVTTESTTAFPFNNGYVRIDDLVDVDDGHGLEEDDYWVIPKSWVNDVGTYSGSPLIVTYNWDCGKIFYSVYETSHGAGSTITPQEYVLLYMILEVGVCEGDYTVE